MINEEEYIVKAQNGDKEAMAELFLGYEGLMKKAARQTHLAVIADEAMSTAQESFLMAVRSFDTGRGIPFPAYAKAKVYGDLRTMFKQYRRMWQREVYPSEDEDGVSFFDTVEDTRNAYESNEMSERIEGLMSGLTVTQRSLLRMLYLEDCTQKAAAARLGITQQAAAAMKRRAVEKMRKMVRG